MHRLKNKSLLVTFVSALIVICVIGVSIWYYHADPLIDDGITTYTDNVGNYKVYTIMLINKSSTDIDIQSVTVNGKMKPDLVQLGITYNSSHMVQYIFRFDQRKAYYDEKHIELTEKDSSTKEGADRSCLAPSFIVVTGQDVEQTSPSTRIEREFLIS